MSEFFFYIARCADNSIYCGSTNNVEQRIIIHNKGLGAKWFRDHGEGVMVYVEKFSSLIEARRRITN